MNTLCYGEILWDIIDQKKCLGGAPFNVACHLSRMGCNSYILSALGSDDLGTSALSKIKYEKVQTDFLKIHDSIPTGTATVFLSNGIPDYEFNFPNAWDNIELTDSQIKTILNTQWDIFCFGTLAQRSETSRKTLCSILPFIKTECRFYDVNFRKEFYSKDILEFCLKFTDVLKLNDEELPVFAELFNLSKADSQSGIDELCFNICRIFNLKGLILTCGKNGSYAYFDGTKNSCYPAKVKVVDTVGAGDSLSAAFLFNYVRTKNPSTALKEGSRLADIVVQHAGALPE